VPTIQRLVSLLQTDEKEKFGCRCDSGPIDQPRGLTKQIAVLSQPVTKKLALSHFAHGQISPREKMN